MSSLRPFRAARLSSASWRVPVRRASSIASQIQQVLNSSKPGELSRQERRKALQVARSLVWQLETPLETVFRTSWMEPQYNAALKICLNLGVFDILSARKPGYISAEAIVDEIRSKDPSNKLQPDLLARFLRHLAAMGAVAECGPGEYAATELTEGMRDPGISGGLDFWFDVSGPNNITMPDFLALTQYENKEDNTNCTWQAAKSTQLTFFGWLKENRQAMKSFASHMTGYASDRGLWTDIYPVKERIIDGAGDSNPLVVDIGGGKGHDMLRLAKNYSVLPSRLYVQDLDVVIAQAQAADSSSGLNYMAHDFFQPQPVKGARAYYTHSVPHNWSDAHCLKIFEHIKGAMTKGYSKLLINEILMPRTGADPVASGLDLIMLGNFGGGVRERTQAEWEDLLQRAGLRVTGVWNNSEVAREAIIEAELT